MDKEWPVAIWVSPSNIPGSAEPHWGVRNNIWENEKVIFCNEMSVWLTAAWLADCRCQNGLGLSALMASFLFALSLTFCLYGFVCFYSLLYFLCFVAIEISVWSYSFLPISNYVKHKFGLQVINLLFSLFFVITYSHICSFECTILEISNTHRHHITCSEDIYGYTLFVNVQ